MDESPITQTMDTMLGKLKSAIDTRKAAENQIAVFTNAVRALAKACENKEIGDSYLATLEELSGKPGFADAIRFVLRVAKKPLAPTEIRAMIQLGKKMDLTVYSNPMASIHTTLRRLADSGEIEACTNEKGEKAYRLKAVSGRMTPAPTLDELKREAERLKATTEGSAKAVSESKDRKFKPI